MEKSRVAALSLLLLLAITATSIAQSGDEVNARLSQIIEQYMNTKDALVHNRDDLSAAWAERLETTIATTPDGIFEEDDLSLWQAFQGALLDAAGSIVDGENLDEQREGLKQLSLELQELIQEFGNPGDPLYVFSCDDYDDGDSVWIHTSNQVANPYHGPENMQCGEQVAEL